MEIRTFGDMHLIIISAGHFWNVYFKTVDRRRNVDVFSRDNNQWII